MLKKIYFGSNLKMYKTTSETVDYLIKLEKYTKDVRQNYPGITLFILPSHTSLEKAVKCIESSEIKIGAQNMCWEEEGQYTGEISPRMLENIGVQLVMAGHSERRQIFGESSFDENKKIIAALKHEFTGLLCVGETEKDKKYGVSDEVLRTQIKIGLHNVKKEQLSKIWIAYEPIWAIGVRGTPASKHYVQEKHNVIKETLYELYGEQSKEIPVLYGGSVNKENAFEIISQPSVDGLYIGRAAWEPENFSALIHNVMEKYWSKNV